MMYVYVLVCFSSFFSRIEVGMRIKKYATDVLFRLYFHAYVHELIIDSILSLPIHSGLTRLHLLILLRIRNFLRFLHSTKNLLFVNVKFIFVFDTNRYLTINN